MKSPSSYAPTVSMERAIARRNVVLQAMLDNGAIDRAHVGGGRARARSCCDDGLRADEPHGQYFKEQVRRELVERFGWERVYQGGLRVFSTIDMPMQKAAEAAVADALKALDEPRARRWRPRARRAGRQRPTTPTPDRARCRPRSSRWTRRPATCARWSAAATSTTSHFNRAVQARAAARLGVQAVRLRRRARGRLHARDA